MTDEERRKDAIKRMAWELMIHDYKMDKEIVNDKMNTKNSLNYYHRLATTFYDYDFEKEKE
jgi:hypothetical protein